MEQTKQRFHSVRLEKDKCRACTNCLKRCPTEAIRVRGGSAHIINKRCIDCGECIRVCDYHAKVAVTDPLEIIEGWKYKIALPAPSLYGQFKNLQNISQLLAALKELGFGAGMGLPNMKRSASEFDIRSEVGTGTTITMSFALA